MELRRELGEIEDLAILYVLPDNQVNAKTLRFIDGNALRGRVHFLRDPQSRAIDQLGLRLANPEPIEAGVPHPATYLLDRQGRVQLIDVREDFHIWLDPEPIIAALERIP